MNRITKYNPSDESMFPYILKDEELSTELDSVHKLGQLEDIEEELGISLITLYKVLKANKIYTWIKGPEWEIDEWDLVLVNIPDKKILYNIYDNDDSNDLNLLEYLSKPLNEYGRSWALTKEELEGNDFPNQQEIY